MKPYIRSEQNVSGLRHSVFLTVLVIVCFILSHRAQGVIPPPDGGYSGGNTAEGQNALLSLTTGGFNTGIGVISLRSNTTGNFNTAVGAGALLTSTADGNTAVGAAALLSASTGFFNTATGSSALVSNTIGFQNTANGIAALNNNTTGIDNTATGAAALHDNQSGGFNTATGFQALAQNTAGFNTATGSDSLLNNTTGHHNTANGMDALHQNTSGNNNVALGNGAGAVLTIGSDNIDIGNPGTPGESSTIRIGVEIVQTATYIAGISGADATGGDPVFITSDGKLGTVNSPSSARFKEEINAMENVSEAIFALKPVTFCYKKEFDPKGTAQFGLVAEEVEKVNPDLVKRDRDGKLQTVRYDAVNAMLLNEFLKEHRKVEEQQTAIAELKSVAAQRQKEFQAAIAEQRKEMEAVVARLKEQDAKIQRVNDRIELARSAPQTAANSD